MYVTQWYFATILYFVCKFNWLWRYAWRPLRAHQIIAQSTFGTLLMLSNAIQLLKFVWVALFGAAVVDPFSGINNGYKCAPFRNIRNNLLELLSSAAHVSPPPDDKTEHLIYIISSKRQNKQTLVNDALNAIKQRHYTRVARWVWHKNWHKNWISVSWSECGDNAATGDLLYVASMEPSRNLLRRFW